jgi:hypothetical protein
MATRTTSQWYDWLLGQKASVEELDVYTDGPANASALIGALTNKSRVAIWALWLWLSAVTARAVEELFDIHALEVEQRAAASIAGNDAWLINQVKLFEEDNVTLTVSPDRTTVYAVSNPANRVVKFCAVVNQRGRAVVKVAGADGDGLPVALGSGVLTQLNSYLDRIQFAGTQLVAMSVAADELKVAGSIYYNGIANLSDLQDAVKEALKLHLANLPFNGQVSLNKLTDAIQAVTSVMDLRVDYTFRKDGVATWAMDPNLPAYLSVAGYVVLNEAEFDSLTWVAL